MKILTVEQMTEVDRLSTEQYGVPSLILMENAGLNLFLSLQEWYSSSLRNQRVAIFCGKGNNGGDGLVLARHLAQLGILPDIFLLGRKDDVGGDAGVNLRICLKAGQNIVEVESEENWVEIERGLKSYDIVVDALLGTGLTKPLRGLYLMAASAINESGAFVLSVDIPSGMFSDSVQGGVQTVEADLTVTFTAPKIAHILNENQEAIGVLRVVPIGSPPQLMDRPDYFLNLLDKGLIGSGFPDRKIASHKGHYGHVAIVAGSQGKSGAAALAGLAALKSGSGLVTVCSPDAIQQIIASYRPELMTEGLSSTDKGSLAEESTPRLMELLAGKDAAAIGPGLGTHQETVKTVRHVVQEAGLPLVIDADGLNAFAGHTEKLSNSLNQPLILTPHPGEFARLVDLPTSQVYADKLALAREFAQHYQVWLVLKDFRTLIAEPSGQIYVSPNGNPGMASAGMGDVLTGVLVSIVGLFAARGLTHPQDITQAVVSAVFVHSLAGDFSAAETGFESLTAGSVIEGLKDAFKELSDADV